MLTRALLILGAFAILEGFSYGSLAVIAAGGIAIGLALLSALIELVAPSR